MEKSNEISSPTLKILRAAQVCEKISMSKSAVYDRLDPNSPRYDPLFPKPIRLGHTKNPPVGFLEHEIDVWIEVQMMQNRVKQMSVEAK